MLPPFWNGGNTPADQFGLSFENICTAHRHVFSGLGKINGRQNDYGDSAVRQSGAPARAAASLTLASNVGSGCTGPIMVD